MKTKPSKESNKVYLLVAFFIIANVLFFVIENASAQTYSECINDYQGTAADCAGYPGDPSVVTQDNYTTYTGSGDTTNSDEFVGPTQTAYTYSECKADGGDEAYCGSFPGAPTTAQNLSTMSDGKCNFNSDCGKGFSCYQESCIDDATYQDNVAWYSRTSNAVSQTFTPGGSVFSGGDTSTSSTSTTSKTAVATTTQPIRLANGTVAPANTVVNSDGSGVSSTGTTYPAGSFTVPGDINNGFVLCANGILAAECRDANGNTIAGSPLSINSNYMEKTGTVAGLAGYATSKCAANMVEIGGVCFPSNTGLSNAPVYVILSNIFSWLMGLFTTLAVLAFVISGIQYLMAAGDESLAKSAKSNATNAVLGIIVGLSGFIIIKAIAAALAGQGYFF